MTMEAILIPILLTLSALTVPAAEEKVSADRRPSQQLGGTTRALTAANATAEFTLESLLGEMTDYAVVARWPQPEFNCKQASSYDRGTVAADKASWFANNDQNQFIRAEENQDRQERVMLDADGPGLDCVTLEKP